MSGSGDATELEDIEVSLLLAAIQKRYGYDFSDYSQASLRRRIKACMQKENVTTLTELQGRIIRDPSCFQRLLDVISIDVSSMFRDPDFYLAIRKHVIPQLKTWPFARIWHAGCACGEEVYSMAILLEEEGIYDRCRVYATDISKMSLNMAEQGIYSRDQVKKYIHNYRAAGGKADFSNYYRSQYENVIIRKELKRNIVFAQHNLASDRSFNEFNLILCRNVMIYFNTQLQDRVFELLHASLSLSGMLALGKMENMRFASVMEHYEPILPDERIYRRIS